MIQIFHLGLKTCLSRLAMLLLDAPQCLKEKPDQKATRAILMHTKYNDEFVVTWKLSPERIRHPEYSCREQSPLWNRGHLLAPTWKNANMNPPLPPIDMVHLIINDVSNASIMQGRNAVRLIIHWCIAGQYILALRCKRSEASNTWQFLGGFLPFLGTIRLARLFLAIHFFK